MSPATLRGVTPTQCAANKRCPRWSRATDWGGSLRRKAVFVALVVVGLVAGGTSAYAFKQFGSYHQFYGPDASGVCARQWGFTDPDYVIGAQRGSGGGRTRALVNANGGTCNSSLSRPQDWIVIDGWLIQSSNSLICAGPFRNRNGSGADSVDAELSRGYGGGAGPCTQGSAQFYGAGRGLLYTGSAYSTGPCCSLGPTLTVPAQ